MQQSTRPCVDIPWVLIPFSFLNQLLLFTTHPWHPLVADIYFEMKSSPAILARRGSGHTSPGNGSIHWKISGFWGNSQFLSLPYEIRLARGPPMLWIFPLGKGATVGHKTWEICLNCSGGIERNILGKKGEVAGNEHYRTICLLVWLLLITIHTTCISALGLRD